MIGVFRSGSLIECRYQQTGRPSTVKSDSRRCKCPGINVNRLYRPQWKPQMECVESCPASRKNLKRIAWLGLLAVIASSIGCSTVGEEGSWITAINASYPTRCAEEDNVYLKLVGSNIRTFRIEALHPAYIGSLTSGNSAPDFSGCSFDGSGNAQDPVHLFKPKRVILWDSEELFIVGNTLERFWRPNSVSVSVNGVHQDDIHLIQVYLKDRHQPARPSDQFLVLYPTDGYWRLKPLAAPHLGTGGYGSSFLVGPVEEALRPVVNLSKVEFIPATRTFELDYQDGSHGSMKIVEINPQRAALEYSHSRPSQADMPIVAVRSMYVAPDNADASQVVFHRRGERAPVSEALMTFVRSDVDDIRIGRSIMSRHNASAPDMWFSRFEPQ